MWHFSLIPILPLLCLFLLPLFLQHQKVIIVKPNNLKPQYKTYHSKISEPITPIFLEAFFHSKSFLLSSQKQGKKNQQRSKLNATLFSSLFYLVCFCCSKTMKMKKVNTLFLVFVILTLVQCSSSKFIFKPNHSSLVFLVLNHVFYIIIVARIYHSNMERGSRNIAKSIEVSNNKKKMKTLFFGYKVLNFQNPFWFMLIKSFFFFFFWY